MDYAVAPTKVGRIVQRKKERRKRNLSLKHDNTAPKQDVRWYYRFLVDFDFFAALDTGTSVRVVTVPPRLGPLVNQLSKRP